MQTTQPRNALYRNSSFLGIWLGEAASSLGASFGTLANSWLLHRLTGSEAALGNMWLIYLLPSLMVQLVIGPYLDRWNRKHIMLFSQLVRAIAFAFPLAMSLAGELVPWHLFLVSLLIGLIQPLYVPSSLAMLPSLIKKQQLPQANATIDGTTRFMMFLGPPVGGLLVALIGAELTLLVVITMYAASFVFLCYCQYVPQPTLPRDTWARQLKEGFRYFWGHQQLVWLGIFLSFVQFAVGVTMVLNLPYVVDELHGTSVLYGMFLASYPLGYFLGSLLVPRIQLRLPLRQVMLGSLLLGGSSFLMLAIVENIWFALAIELFAGITAPFFHVHSTSLYQRVVPAELQGRVFSVRLLIIRSVMPLGTLLGSYGAEVGGIRPVLALVGTMVCVAAILGMVLPWFRFLGREQNGTLADS
ncbi:MAG: MFS transporter [Clostridia bacterium]